MLSATNSAWIFKGKYIVSNKLGWVDETDLW